MRKVLDKTSSPDSGVLLQNTLLILILVIATAYRFYGIDQVGLWGTELVNAHDVSHVGLFDLVRKSISREVGMPGYEILLYIVTQSLGGSEFALRFLSAAAGVGSVWLLILLGARCGTVCGGYFAAARLAGSPLAITYSQEAMLYSILVFFALLQIYTFFGLFFTRDNSVSPRPCTFSVGLKNNTGSFAVSLNPEIGVDACRVIAFWLATAMLISFSYSGFALVLPELLLCVLCLWVNRNSNLAALTRYVFLPIIVLLLVFMPVFVAHYPQLTNMEDCGWIIKPNTPFLLLSLFGSNIAFQLMAVLGFLLALVVIGLQFFYPGKWRRNTSMAALVAIAGLYLFVVLFMNYLICTVNLKEYRLVLQPFVMLAAGFGLCFFAGRWFESTVAGKSVFAVLMLALMFFQFNNNMAANMYDESRKPDLRQVVALIAADKDFMQGRRTVLTSDMTPAYYLDRYGISQDSQFNLHSHKKAPPVDIGNIITVDDFYYIDVGSAGPKGELSANLQSLVARYGVICLSRFQSTLLVKLGVGLSPAGVDAAVDCADLSATDIRVREQAP